MKMIIHDLSQQDFAALYTSKDTDTIISDNGSIRNCIGCFGCWVKTPGVCILKDGYHNMGELLAKCDKLVMISKCIYGSYSPFIRNIWDRSLPYLLPYFVSKNEETHHKNRYKNEIELSLHFYGENISESEQKTAKALVKANAINFYMSESNIFFYKDFRDMGGQFYEHCND